MPITPPTFDFPTQTAIFQGLQSFLQDHLIDGVAAPERYNAALPDQPGVKFFSGAYRFDGNADEAVEIGMTSRDQAPSAAPDEQDYKPFLIFGYDTERAVETLASGDPLVTMLPVAIFACLPYRGRGHIQSDAEILDLAQDLILFFLRQRFFTLSLDGQYGIIWRSPRGGQLARRDVGFRQMNYDIVRVITG